MDVESLKLSEVRILLDLADAGSMHELARRLNMHAGQLSKAVKSAEAKLGRRILNRTSQGVYFTDYGREILPTLKGLRDHIESLKGSSPEKDKEALIIATTSFFSSQFVPFLLSELEKEKSTLHCQILELPPSQFVTSGLRNAFTACIHLKDLEWPKTWTSVELGNVRWQLYCRRGHPLTKGASLKEVLKYRFVTPIYWTHEGVRKGKDQFPLVGERRLQGFETATAIGAAHVVARTDQIAFLPHLVVESTPGLVSLDVKGLRKVEEPVFLTVKSDAVKQKVLDWLVSQSKKLLEKDR
jgi:DNA-binding transcriptional LysR family regulator